MILFYHRRLLFSYLQTFLHRPTKSLLANVDSFTQRLKNPNALQVGHVLDGVVLDISQSFVSIRLLTQDSRNKGPVHISQIDNRWIEDINDEFVKGDTVRVKIIGDTFDTSPYGWELSTILS